MAKFLLIGLGGALGSMLRYWASGWVQQTLAGSTFPFGTMAVNVAGCLVLGVLAQLSEARGLFTPETRALVFIGLLGGFTTFSSFAGESINLLRDGDSLGAAINVGAHILLGLAAVWAGRTGAQLLWR